MMNFTRSPPASLQLVFDISKVRFNRPGYFFLKLTAQNGAPSVRQDGDNNNDDVWVKMPELSNCFMHAYSRINDPVKQKDPNQHVAVSDGQFTFFLSRDFLQNGKEEQVCIWIEAFEFLDLKDDDKLKKIGEAKYSIFGDNFRTPDQETGRSASMTEHEVKCKVTHTELPTPPDYSQLKKCPGQYVELHLAEAKVRSVDMNFCLKSVDVDIQSYDEILERATRFAPLGQITEGDVENIEDAVTPARPPVDEQPVIRVPTQPKPAESRKTVTEPCSSTPASTAPSRLREFGSNLLNKVKRKETAKTADKGMSQVIRSLLSVKANSANLMGRLPLGVKQVDYGVEAILGSMLPAVAPAFACGTAVYSTNDNTNAVNPSTLRHDTGGVRTPAMDAVDEEVRKVTGVGSHVQTASITSPVCTQAVGETAVDEATAVHESATVNDPTTVAYACKSEPDMMDTGLNEQLHEQLSSQEEELGRYRISASKLNVEISNLQDKITALEHRKLELKRQGSRCLDCNGISTHTHSESSGAVLQGAIAEDETEEGREKKDTGTHEDKTGTQGGHTDTHEGQTGTHEWQTGTHEGQTGTHEGQTGTHEGQTGTHEGQTGTREGQTGTHEGQTGTQGVETETKDDQTETQGDEAGTQAVETGTQGGETGTQDGQPGTQEGQNGTQRDETGTQEGQTGMQADDTGTLEDQTGKQMMEMEKAYEHQLGLLQQLQKNGGSKDQTAESLMEEIKAMLAAQKEGPSDDDVTKDFERLYLLEKLCRAQSRIESLDKQLQDNAKQWGKEKSAYRIQLLDSEKQLSHKSPDSAVKSLKWDMRRASFGLNISRRLTSSTHPNSKKQLPTSDGALKPKPPKHPKQKRRP